MKHKPSRRKPVAANPPPILIDTPEYWLGKIHGQVLSVPSSADPIETEEERRAKIKAFDSIRLEFKRMFMRIGGRIAAENRAAGE